jgi:large subunit ribosomal protein L13
MKTYTARAADIQRRWHLIDAEGKTLGRLASEVAQLLKGKHKPAYTPHLDLGDFVVVINAARVNVTGNKLQDKFYYRHSGYPGGFRKVSLRDKLASRPEAVVEEAVRGMLPHNRLGEAMSRKLKVYAGPEHPHQAQFAGQERESHEGEVR